MKKSEIKYQVISVFSFLLFLILWELISDVFKLVPTYSLPSPIAVVKAFITKLYSDTLDGATLFGHIFSSLRVAFTGFLLGAAVGIPLGIFMAWNKTIDNIVRPVFDLLRPIPPVGWIPIMIILLGIGFMAKASVIFIAAFVPCVINSYSGIKQTNPVLIWVARTFGATDSEVLGQIAIPSALPMIFTALRVSLNASWMSLVAAELLAANRGLGYMLQIARMAGRPDVIIVSIFTIGAIGTICNSLLGKIERKYIRGEY